MGRDTKYSGYVDNDGVYFGRRTQKSMKELPPGVYTVAYNQEVGVLLEATESKYDTLIDLPSAEYTNIMKDLGIFLKPETKIKFKKHGFVYKRSAILHGLPGTGKTCIVNRVIEKVIESGGIVLFNPNPELLKETYKLIDNTEPNRLVMVIFEEFDELLEDFEDDLLSLLDGEIQKDNVMYLATTNHIEKIPARIMRPGRFSSIVEVLFPNIEARQHYLNIKLPDNDNTSWAELTDGFSIDELKETVLCVECLGYSLEESIARVKTSKGVDPKRFEKESEGNVLLNGAQLSMHSLLREHDKIMKQRAFYTVKKI